MKNALLKSFLALFILINMIYFSSIISIFYLISEGVYLFVNFDLIAIILSVIYLLIFVFFLVHYFKKRDKNELIMPVEFKSPDMNPAEVGFLVDGVVDGEDLSALMVFWAGKNFIEITKEKKNQKIIKLVDQLPDDSKEYEKLLFNLIFNNDKEVLVKNIASRVNANEGGYVKKIANEIETSVGEKYFNKKTLWYRQFYILAFAILFWFSATYFRVEFYADILPIVEIFVIVATVLLVACADWVLNYYDYRHKNSSSKGRTVSFICFIILLGLVGALCFFFYLTDIFQMIILCVELVLFGFVVLLSRKIMIYTKEGQERLGQILGFKNFINVAEGDRIKMMVEENPNVFYEILPYAFVLGVSEKWIKRLDVIKGIPQINDSNIAKTLFYSALLNSGAFSVFIIAKTSILKVAGAVISLGRNGGRGGSKGGSNFGGIRRR